MHGVKKSTGMCEQRRNVVRACRQVQQEWRCVAPTCARACMRVCVHAGKAQCPDYYAECMVHVAGVETEMEGGRHSRQTWRMALCTKRKVMVCRRVVMQKVKNYIVVGNMQQQKKCSVQCVPEREMMVESAACSCF